MSEKELIIPIVTPVFNLHDRKPAILTDKDERYRIDKHFINTDTLVFLKNTFTRSAKPICDGILLGGTAGEGDKLDLELWKELVDASVSVFSNWIKNDKEKEFKFIVGVLFDREVDRRKAFEYIDAHYGGTVKHRLVKIPEEKYNKSDFEKFFVDNFKKIDIHYWMYFTKGHSRVKNDYIVSTIRKLKENGISEISIKDARKRDDEDIDIIKLIDNLNGDAKVYEGWEDRFQQTRDMVAGGIFPLANIEPKLFRRIVDDKNDNKNVKSYEIAAVPSMLKKYGEGEGWVNRLKETLYSSPDELKLRFDYFNFNQAWNNYFKIYSEEPVFNIHVKSFDPKNPHLSMMRTFLSDVLSFQTLYFKHNKTEKLLFFPVAFELTEGSNKSPTKYCLRNSTDPEKFLEKYFINYYAIEEFVLEENRLFRPSKGLFKKMEVKYDLKKIEKNTKSESISYTSENGKESWQLKLCYVVNNELIAAVPPFVLENIFRIAVFTKRNAEVMVRMKESALRSATASIFARNYAHHIGSHVKNRATPDRVRERALDLYADLKK